MILKLMLTVWQLWRINPSHSLMAIIEVERQMSLAVLFCASYSIIQRQTRALGNTGVCNEVEQMQNSLRIVAKCKEPMNT